MVCNPSYIIIIVDIVTIVDLSHVLYIFLNRTHEGVLFCPSIRNIAIFSQNIYFNMNSARVLSTVCE